MGAPFSLFSWESFTLVGDTPINRMGLRIRGSRLPEQNCSFSHRLGRYLEMLPAHTRHGNLQVAQLFKINLAIAVGVYLCHCHIAIQPTPLHSLHAQWICGNTGILLVADFEATPWSVTALRTASLSPPCPSHWKQGQCDGSIRALEAPKKGAWINVHP